MPTAQLLKLVAEDRGREAAPEPDAAPVAASDEVNKRSSGVFFSRGAEILGTWRNVPRPDGQGSGASQGVASCPTGGRVWRVAARNHADSSRRILPWSDGCAGLGD
jgi:hypothetical protein